METTVKEKGSYSILDNPAYYGAYLNMALNNFILINNYLANTFGYMKLKEISDEKEIPKQTYFLAQIFDVQQTTNDENRIRVYNYLLKRHHLPAIKIFGMGKDIPVAFDKLNKFIQLCGNELYRLRNSFSHYLAVAQDGTIQKRSYHVADELLPFLEELYNHAPEFSFLRFNSTQDRENYAHLNSKYYRIIDEKGITEQGFFFFINLFLERAPATKFLKKIRGYKNETTPPYKATLQVFTSYTLRLPDEKLGNEDPKHSLLMEMLNELYKCPKELYQQLGEKDKKQFEPALTTEAQQNIMDNTQYDTVSDSDIEQLISEQVSLKRHGDRFPYFALRYIDEMECFKNIRFQITVGKLCEVAYAKEVGGIVNERRIVNIVNRFGRLGDFEGKEAEILAQLKGEDSAKQAYCFDQYNPHYNISNNKIAFLITDKATTDNVAPSGFISIHELHKILMGLLLKLDIENIITKFVTEKNPKLLNKENLDAIKKDICYTPTTFTRRIDTDKKKLLRDKKKRDKEADKVAEYKSLYAERIALLNEKLKPYKLNAMQLPQVVRDYLTDVVEPNTQKSIHTRIKAMREDCKERLKAIRKEKEKPKDQQKIKLGELATYLATDIIDMVADKDIKQKITSVYYNHIQNKLAYFGDIEKKQALIAILESLEIFDPNKGHVFLTKKLINDCNGIVEFYEKYLLAKNGEKQGFKTIHSGWYDRLAHSYKQDGKNKTDYRLDIAPLPYSLQRLKEEVTSKQNLDIAQWLTNKAKMPVNLPTDIFDNVLIGKLEKETTASNKKISGLIADYVGGDTQPFYALPRNYDKRITKQVFDSMKKRKVPQTTFEEITVKATETATYQLKDKFGNKTVKNEKVIRFYQTKDRVVRLMCAELLKDSQKTAQDYSLLLAQMYPTAENGILDTNARFEHPLKNLTIVAEDNEGQKQAVAAYKLLKDPTAKAHYPAQKGYEWTIKDYGKFRRFIKDKRINIMADYFESNILPYSIVRYQIEQYEMYWHKVFELTFALEKTIAEKDQAGIVQEKNKVRNDKSFNEVQFQEYLNWIAANYPETDTETIGLIRNKFSHAQLPPNKPDEQNGKHLTIAKITVAQTEQFDRDRNKTNDDPSKERIDVSIPKKIYEQYETLINELITKLKQ